MHAQKRSQSATVRETLQRKYKVGFFFAKNTNLFKVAKVIVPSKAFQIIECVDVIKSVSVISLRQHSGLAALLKEPSHQFGHIKFAIMV